MSSPLSERLERLASRQVSAPASLLLTGPDEALLEREARLYAAALLCPGGDPDRRCESCRRALAGLHPDLLLVDPEGVQIRVDRIREALAFAAGRPYEAARRVARISRAELLGGEAGNALLKALEEPGAAFEWILTTTRPEALLATIRSRCAVVRVPAPSAAERALAWQARGHSPVDAADLALIEREVADPRPEDLGAFRTRRAELLQALAGALEPSGMPAVLLLAERVGRAEKTEAALFTELLTDAALASAGPLDRVRHQAVAGELARIGARAGPAALAAAALKAADPPPDNRRGNRRLHFESLLLELWLAIRNV